MSILELLVMNKLIDLLTKPWIELPAYKFGIIDKNGKQLRTTYQLKTSQEKNAYGTLQKFAFNLRRLIEKLPGGKSQLAKYLSVYALFKEDTDLNDKFLENFENINSIDTLFEEHFPDENI
jgi:hypothetical protein